MIEKKKDVSWVGRGRGRGGRGMVDFHICAGATGQAKESNCRDLPFFSCRQTLNLFAQPLLLAKSTNIYDLP